VIGPTTRANEKSLVVRRVSTDEIVKPAKITKSNCHGCRMKLMVGSIVRRKPSPCCLSRRISRAGLAENEELQSP